MVIARVLALALLALLLGCGQPSEEEAAAPPPPPPDIKVVNSAEPGQPVNLAEHWAPGKTTLFEFYSDHCAGSREMAPVMDYLAEHRSEDLVVRKIDIDRRGADGIDFDSPLADQHGLDTIPYFRIYDPEGKLVAKGDEARDLVRQWYHDAQVGEAAEAHPELSERYREPDPDAR